MRSINKNEMLIEIKKKKRDSMDVILTSIKMLNLLYHDQSNLLGKYLNQLILQCYNYNTVNPLIRFLIVSKKINISK